MNQSYSFTIERMPQNDPVVFQLQGQLLAGSITEFDDAITKVQDLAVSAFHLDMKRLDYIDSRGMGALVYWHRLFSEKGTGFRLINVRKDVRRAFELTNLSSLFDMVPSPEEITAQLNRQRRALWESHEFTTQIITALGEGVIGLDTDGRVLFMNPAAENLLGWHEDDLLGEDFEDHVQIECMEKIGFAITTGRQLFTETLNGTACIRRSEFTLRRRTGDRIPVWMTATPVQRAGENAGIILGFLDLSGRKNLESALARGEQRLLAICEHTPDAIVIFHNPDEQFAYANPACARLSGYSIEELSTWPPAASVSTETWRANAESMRRAMNGEHCPPRHIQMRTRNDQEKWLEQNWVPMFDEVGQLYGIMGLARDITSDKIAEEQLRDSEDRFRRIFNGLNAYMFSVDVQYGAIANICHSSQCEAFTGYTFQDFQENPLLWSAIVAEADKPAFSDYIRSILAGEPGPTISYRIIRRDGTERWVRSTTVSKFLKITNTTRYDVLIEDITEHRMMEEDLRQAHKMEAVGQLAGGIAHDFNNLLTGILGNLSLADIDAPVNIKPLLAQAQKAGQRAAELVGQLLAFSRKSQVVMKATDIKKVIDDVVDMAQKTFDKRIVLRQTTQSELPWVIGDSVQLHHVLLNLCVNARDALEMQQLNDKERPLEIVIEAQHIEVDEEYCAKYSYARKGSYICLSVSDTGIGMDKETQKHIFEPFFTTKELGKGTGLGLSSVYGIIKQHEGWVHVYSEPEEGTTFRVYLPLALEEGSERNQIESEEMPEGSETLLIVDDEEMIRSLGKAILERLGYKIMVGVDGKDGLRMFLEHKDEIDLVILDISMPFLSGIEVMDQIHTIEPDAKVILASGYSEAGHRRRSDDHHESAYVSKPFRMLDLALAVRRVLDEKKK